MSSRKIPAQKKKPTEKICRYGTSKPVSRVLSFKAIICLGAELLLRSRHPSKLWPSKPLLSVLLRIGFTGHSSLLYAGELLPRLSTLTCREAGGISLLHFPLRSPSAAVSRYPALWSPDFPHLKKSSVIARPTRREYSISSYKKSQPCLLIF